jgi:hypothetical protein
MTGCAILFSRITFVVKFGIHVQFGSGSAVLGIPVLQGYRALGKLMYVLINLERKIAA